MRLYIDQIHNDLEMKEKGSSSKRLLQYVLERELGQPYERLEVIKDIYGKPSLKRISDFHFNISHSGKYIICGTSDKPVGVDIEEMKPIEYATLTKEFFSQPEIEYILNGHETNPLERFYEIWTLKESYLKCMGVGLSKPLNSFAVTYGQQGYTIRNENQSRASQYVLEKIDIDPAYKVAVCSYEKPMTIQIIQLG